VFINAQNVQKYASEILGLHSIHTVLLSYWIIGKNHLYALHRLLLMSIIINSCTKTFSIIKCQMSAAKENYFSTSWRLHSLMGRSHVCCTARCCAALVKIQAFIGAAQRMCERPLAMLRAGSEQRLVHTTWSELNWSPVRELRFSTVQFSSVHVLWTDLNAVDQIPITNK